MTPAVSHVAVFLLCFLQICLLFLQFNENAPIVHLQQYILLSVCLLLDPQKQFQIIFYPFSPSLPPLLGKNRCTCPTSYPPPTTHTPHSPHLNAHRNARGMTQSAKTWPAWSTLCSTADLMNGHSDTQTKLRVDFYYTVRSKVTQSTDRSRNQR